MTGGKLLFLSTLTAWPAAACPLCHTATAEQVRAGLAATASDPTVLAAATLPFLTIGIVIRLLNRHEDEDPKEKSNGHKGA